MADTPKLDKKKLIPAGEAFNILSFGVKAIQETTAGVKKSMQARIKQQKQIKKDQKIAAARLLNKQKKEDYRDNNNNNNNETKTKKESIG